MVPAGWYESAVYNLFFLNVINGYPDGTFKPNELITRAEAAAVINRSLDKGFATSAEGLIENNSRNFSDVAGDHWAKEAIDKLAMEGILKGYLDHTFRPDAGITRAEFAVLLSRIRNFSS